MNTAHAASKAGKPVPPGSLGLPWIGETLAFVQDSFAFFATSSQIRSFRTVAAHGKATAAPAKSWPSS